MERLKDIQKEVDAWVQTTKAGYWQPLENFARLAEEVGEVSRELNIRFGPKKKKSADDGADLENEMGDIIFTLACLANSLELDLDRGFNHAMGKVHGRDKDLHEKKL